MEIYIPYLLITSLGTTNAGVDCKCSAPATRLWNPTTVKFTKDPKCIFHKIFTVLLCKYLLMVNLLYKSTMIDHTPVGDRAVIPTLYIALVHCAPPVREGGLIRITRARWSELTTSTWRVF